MKRLLIIAPLLLAGACGQSTDTAEAETSVRSAFDGVWRWSSANEPMYELTIADGAVQSVRPLHKLARPLSYAHCQCAIDRADGLQAIQLVSDPDERGHRLRWVFSFVEGRDHGRRGPQDTSRGVFFEEIVTPHELPSPRTMVQRGALRRLTF